MSEARLQRLQRACLKDQIRARRRIATSLVVGAFDMALEHSVPPATIVGHGSDAEIDYALKHGVSREEAAKRLGNS